MAIVGTKVIKHEYLRSRASSCVLLSSSVPGHLSIKLSTIEILVLISWIPASKNLRQKFRERNVFTKEVTLVFPHCVMNPHKDFEN